MGLVQCEGGIVRVWYSVSVVLCGVGTVCWWYFEGLVQCEGGITHCTNLSQFHLDIE